MELRATFDSSVFQALAANRQASDRLAVLEQQATAGKQLLVPSDDPAGAAALLGTTAQTDRLSTYLQNIQRVTADLNASSAALSDVSSALDQARQIALQAANSGNDTSSFASYAAQVDGIINQVLQDANTQNQGSYVFSGTATNTAPFVLNPSTGRVDYVGGSDPLQVDVAPQSAVTTWQPGSAIFRQRQRQATVYTGPTGAASGAGTDSETGQGTLLVAHTTTTYAPGSGVQAGTGSAAGDSVLGPSGANHLTIVDTSGTGAAGTVSLNGGPPVAFTNSDTNLQVAGPSGEVVFVNTTAITPGFNGNVDLTADGTLSTDGGLTATPIDFSADQVVTDSRTGGVTHVNSTNVRGTGTDQVNYPGTYDVFQVLQALRDDLRNTRGLSASEQIGSISGRVAELDRVRGDVLQAEGTQGATLQNLQGVQAQLKTVQLNLQDQTNNLAGADLGTILVNLQAQSTLLQLTQAVAARLFNQNLLDFLK